MITTVEFYACQCDNCGKSWYNDHYGWSAMNDESGLKDTISNDDWQIGDHLDGEEHRGKHYCPSCYEFDDNDNFTLKQIK